MKHNGEEIDENTPRYDDLCFNVQVELETIYHFQSLLLNVLFDATLTEENIKSTFYTNFGY